MPIETPVKRLLSLVFTLLLFSASSLAQTLLFSTGFEPNTQLCYNGACVAGGTNVLNLAGSFGSAVSLTPFPALSGTDNSTGFTFPLPEFGGPASQNGIRVESAGSGNWNGYFNDYIDTNASDCHSGSQCLYMEMENFTTNICCPQQPVGQASLGQTVRELYERFWIKLPSSWDTVQANYNSYSNESFMYFKTLDDFRIEPGIWSAASYCRSGSSPGSCTWYAHSEVDDGAINGDKGYDDPVTGTFIADPDAAFKYGFGNNYSYNVASGNWHLVEVYLKRSPYPNDGRYFYSVDGHVGLDYYGQTMGAMTEDIQDLGYLTQYDGLYPDIRWVDDWQIWSTIPCSALPCQSNGVGQSSALAGEAMPTYTTYNGAIGAVNVPFSYYLGTNVAPASYSFGGSGNGISGLPAGLSYNNSTQLITGTPTSTTSCTYNSTPIACQYMITLSNSEGDTSFIPLFIMINSSVQTPVIKYLWADGGTIKWAVMGAGTVSLSINNGVGAINNTNNQAMNGSVTVSNTGTYTLTASNSAGSVSATVAVTTTTTAPTAPNPPTGLAATVN
jgi:hypothetical protein